MHVKTSSVHPPVMCCRHRIPKVVGGIAPLSPTDLALEDMRCDAIEHHYRGRTRMNRVWNKKWTILARVLVSVCGIAQARDPGHEVLVARAGWAVLNGGTTGARARQRVARQRCAPATNSWQLWCITERHCCVDEPVSLSPFHKQCASHGLGFTHSFVWLIDGVATRHDLANSQRDGFGRQRRSLTENDHGSRCGAGGVREG